jgi:hypothetical protein
MDGSLYLDPTRSGIRWLLDPAVPAVAEIARAVKARTDVTPCDPEAVATDLGELPALLSERHFGVVTGLVDEAAVQEAERLILAARDRVLADRTATWGDALGDLNDDLRRCLRDRHVRMAGSRPSRIRADELVAPRIEGAPAVEVAELDGVLCVTVRRLWGGPEDDRALWGWAGQSLDHFAYERIVVDLRGNDGGNDALTWAWIERVIPEGARIPGASDGWYVGDVPLGLWNSAAVVEAQDGLEAVPTWHREHRHAPAPDDVLDLRSESEPGDDELPTGERPWHGRMLVVVDGGTKSSGESSAWMLWHALGARLIGRPTSGMIEYGNIVPYLLPASGLHIALPTKHNDFGIPVELVGLPVHGDLDPATPVADVAARFDELFSAPNRRLTLP